MDTSTLGDGLSGSHPSRRNARPGLVTRTFLSETTANPLFLVDKADKPSDAWREDPYRPFYSLLEPENARAFVEDFLGFPIDASRISWVRAGNEVELLPAPVLDRLSILRVSSMDQAQARSVAASNYETANAERDGFTDKREAMEGARPGDEARTVIRSASWRSVDRTVVSHPDMPHHPIEDLGPDRAAVRGSGHVSRPALEAALDASSVGLDRVGPPAGASIHSEGTMNIHPGTSPRSGAHSVRIRARDGPHCPVQGGSPHD
jgi:hypothetical protein